MTTHTVNIVDEEINIGNDTFQVVLIFKYLGDTICCNGRCSDAVSSRMISAWKDFAELLPLLTNRTIQLKLRGNVFNS